MEEIVKYIYFYQYKFKSTFKYLNINYDIDSSILIKSIFIKQSLLKNTFTSIYPNTYSLCTQKKEKDENIDLININ